MNLSNFPNFLTLCLAAVLPSILNLPPISTSQNDPYTICGAKFRCGHLTAVGYPFWGGDRAKNCGDPRLRLVCENATTAIDINNVKYRVLDIKPETQVFKIARIDLSQNLCLQEFTKTTLDSEIFDYASKCVDLIFLYGCPAPAVDLHMPFQFDCAVKGAAERNGYVNFRELVIPGVCHFNVVVPVTVSYESFLNYKDLRQLVGQGFEVRLKVNGSACRECENSGGRCGHDAAGKQFVCFCRDGLAAESESCAVAVGVHTRGSEAVMPGSEPGMHLPG